MISVCPGKWTALQQIEGLGKFHPFTSLSLQSELKELARRKCQIDQEI